MESYLFLLAGFGVYAFGACAVAWAFMRFLADGELADEDGLTGGGVLFVVLWPVLACAYGLAAIAALALSPVLIPAGLFGWIIYMRHVRKAPAPSHTGEG